MGIMLLHPAVDRQRLLGGTGPAERIAQGQVGVEQRGPLTRSERELHALLVVDDRVRLQRHEPVGDPRGTAPVLGPLVSLERQAQLLGGAGEVTDEQQPVGELAVEIGALRIVEDPLLELRQLVAGRRHDAGRGVDERKSGGRRSRLGVILDEVELQVRLRLPGFQEVHFGCRQLEIDILRDVDQALDRLRFSDAGVGLVHGLESHAVEFDLLGPRIQLESGHGAERSELEVGIVGRFQSREGLERGGRLTVQTARGFRALVHRLGEFEPFRRRRRRDHRHVGRVGGLCGGRRRNLESRVEEHEAAVSRRHRRGMQRVRHRRRCPRVAGRDRRPGVVV